LGDNFGPKFPNLHDPYSTTILYDIYTVLYDIYLDLLLDQQGLGFLAQKSHQEIRYKYLLSDSMTALGIGIAKPKKSSDQL